MGSEIARAEQELSAAVRERRIQAWGRREVNGKAHGLIEKLPPDPFTVKDVEMAVKILGDMQPVKPYKQYDGPRWRDIEFDATEVKSTWPASGNSSFVKNWMAHEAENLRAAGTLGKRDQMVRDCMKSTRCTQRQALTAYKALPPELRRHRGKPATNV
jgi:hypothetical protein